MANKQPDKVVTQPALFDGDAEGAQWSELVATGAPDAPEFASRAPVEPPAGDGAALGRPAEHLYGLFDNTELQREYARQITALLEKVTGSGYGPSYVFGDFLDVVEASLDMLPAHLASAARSGKLAEDTPEVDQLFVRLRTRYRAEHFELFAKAFALLLESTEHGYMDVLGEVFMTFTHPNPGLGQHMTPWNVCLAMSAMTIQNGEREVHERLKQAIEQSPLAQAALLTGLLFKEDQQDEAFRWFITRVIPPALPYYESIRVCDPCVGSGRMLLAAAACYPAWTVHLNLVQFFGADIDPTCVQTARINMLLYGLNGTNCHWKHSFADSTCDPETLSAHLAGDLRTAKRHLVVMEDATPEKILKTVQLDLFEYWAARGAQASQPGDRDPSAETDDHAGGQPGEPVGELVTEV